MPSLRYTDTNSADDREGAAWGIPDRLIWCLVGGVSLSLTLFLLLQLLIRDFGFKYHSLRFQSRHVQLRRLSYRKSCMGNPKQTIDCLKSPL